MSLCVSPVNHPSVSRARWRGSSWTFLNQVSVRLHLGCNSPGKDWYTWRSRKRKNGCTCDGQIIQGKRAGLKRFGRLVLAILWFAEVQIRNANECLSSLLIGFRSNQLFTQAEGSSGSEEAVASEPCVSLPCAAIFAWLCSPDSSSILPRLPLLPGWYERMTSEPSGVKRYKVIGRSSLLTGRPLKGRLSGANRLQRPPPPHVSRPSPSHPTLPSSSAACVTWPGRGVRGGMINDAFSTCLEWSCPRCTVITHSQAAAAQHNCFLFVDLVYWGERWLGLGEKVFRTVERGEGTGISQIFRVSLFLRDRAMAPPQPYV